LAAFRWIGAMTGHVILAEDDQGNGLSIGPVYTERSLEQLRREITEYGWTVTGTCLHYSRADFTCARGRGEGLVTGDRTMKGQS
jgi:hypothetical protein